jgi:Xaa-Pro dipeptidase
MTQVFPEQEFLGRTTRFQEALAASDIDLAIVSTPENINYLTGHGSPGYYTYQCLLVPQSGEPTLLTRETEVINAEESSYLTHIVGYADTDDPIATTVDLGKSIAPTVETLGLEQRSWFLVPSDYLRLEESFSARRTLPVDELVNDLRLIKSDLEIAKIRQAARITNAGMRAGACAAVPGAREADVAAAVFSTMVSEGSGYFGMEPFVASGPRAGNIHASWTDRVIRPEEGVLLEMAASFDRYHAPLMYTVWTGELEARAALMAQACIAAREAAIACVKPGSTPEAADEACRQAIADFGLSDTYRKRTGYSVGIAFAPDWGEGHILSLKKGETREFKPGMVVHVVPTLRQGGYAGMGFSGAVLVTEEGHEVLTSCDVVQPGA